MHSLMAQLLKYHHGPKSKLVNLTVEFRLETRRNSSESSVEGFCDLRGEEVVREQENRLGTGWDRNKKTAA